MDTTLILPARNDSVAVGAMSRATYAELAEAGVKIFEFLGGLLHAKTLVVDGEAALIGSANMDRRSLELNFENNILFADPAFAEVLRARQDDYLRSSRKVTREDVCSYNVARRLWQNLLATLSPIL